MEVSRSAQHTKHSAKINAVVQVHSSLRNNMLPKGPLDGQADVIYMTDIASSAPGSPPAKEVDELIFLLPHWPDTIRFWIDERPVGHPDAAQEKVRRGQLDDGKNCSVIKVCINQNIATNLAINSGESARESDIYLPPSSRAARVWIYLDPTKQVRGQKERGEKSAGLKEATTAAAHTSPRQSAPRARKSIRKPQTLPEQLPQKPLQAPRKPTEELKRPSQPPRRPTSPANIQRPLAPNRPWPPVPERRSSKKAIARSPLAAYPPISGTTSPPSEKKKPPVTPNSPAKKTATREKKLLPVEPEPEDFKNDILNDISRLMTHSDPFGRFHNTGLPDSSDSDEERDTFPAAPFDGNLPSLGKAQPEKFYKAGHRARSSVFFSQEALPGDHKIDVSYDEEPKVEQEFTKPSMRRRLKTRLSDVLHRLNHH